MLFHDIKIFLTFDNSIPTAYEFEKLFSFYIAKNQLKIK